MQLSEATRAILDELREVRGDVVIKSADAQKMYAGAGGAVSSLSDEDLVQVALLQAYELLQESRDIIAAQTAFISSYRPNRAQRRKK